MWCSKESEWTSSHRGLRSQTPWATIRPWCCPTLGQAPLFIQLPKPPYLSSCTMSSSPSSYSPVLCRTDRTSKTWEVLTTVSCLWKAFRWCWQVIPGRVKPSGAPSTWAKGGNTWAKPQLCHFWCDLGHVTSSLSLSFLIIWRWLCFPCLTPGEEITWDPGCLWCQSRHLTVLDTPTASCVGPVSWFVRGRDSTSHSMVPKVPQ